MERLRQGGVGGVPGCVLVASASFWEGVDVPGEMLQLVIIDKLPFPVPNDPVVEARTQRIEAEGGSVFMDYFVPEAAVALKQGAGRLIRHESDKGVLVVCDTRLVSMGYGKRIRAALPPMRVLKTDAEFYEALTALRPATTPSTMESP
jgi:ATP-dependent DNA helicase DinG